MNNKIKNKIFTFVGIFLILSPFLGFPKTIKDILFIFSGLVIVWLTFSSAEKWHDNEINQIKREGENSEVKNLRV